MSKILIVEDDKTIALGIEYSLKQEGFQTEVAHDKSSAEKILQTSEFNLVLLDVSLPDGNGFDLCRTIREQGDTPVIFLTVRDEEVNVVMGLDIGADDYVTKPFRVRELISRIKSVLRRYEQQPPQKTEIRLGEVLIDTAQARVFKQRKEIILTALEYRLLLTLANHAGQVLSRKQILEHIWDVAGDFVNDNTLTVYIKRLREKIEDDPHRPKLIQTVRGLGYKAGVGFETD
ncbi:MAG: response regulator transcription factor [Novibacillus thermophilus]|jgi:DNA-binding response OmpR family regulator|uniref:DNA-binding response regulator n=1 Tax=Novibacillus thermophilus TaxID=1471761 RepID=A0A1U9K7D3_9BACL|nr:response regulator transcription factor [Novibacillus thermophilus]AQS55967.1 DNA-binding response regulator [Novibacillus thermophilus]